MPSSLRFGAFLVYPPAPVDDHGRAVKNFILGLKQDRVRGGVSSSRHVARRIHDLSDQHALIRFLHNSFLVPAPKSTPLTAGALWAPDRIARALVGVGIGRDVVDLVERIEAVNPSHQSPGAERAWPDQHQRTVEVKRDLPLGFDGRLILVDDVITRGSTLLGCALALREAYPQADIAGFAVARTLRREEPMPAEAIQPVIGVIEWSPGWISRDP